MSVSSLLKSSTHVLYGYPQILVLRCPFYKFDQFDGNSHTPVLHQQPPKCWSEVILRVARAAAVAGGDHEVVWGEPKEDKILKRIPQGYLRKGSYAGSSPSDVF